VHLLPELKHKPWRWVYLYVLLIPLVNWGFAHIPTIPMPDGGTWAPMAIVTGLILVVRDFAQREVSHYILLPLVIGLALSYFMAPAEIALASGIAFGVSEMVDYIVYTTSDRPLSERVLISSSISAPIDTALFLLVANIAIPGLFTWLTLITSIVSKIFGAYVVYRILKARELKVALTQTRG
jgi:uncharacterized PurR-regulated membrane protein YhhQ (DUF165 family)